jgi:chaperonin GroES
MGGDYRPSVPDEHRERSAATGVDWPALGLTLAAAPAFAGSLRVARTGLGCTAAHHTRVNLMAIRPLQDRILLRRVEEESKTKGGIIIPDTAKEKPMEGIIVAAGPGAVLKNGKRREPNVKKGDRVLFSKYSGNEVKIDGTEHLLVREEDILAIIEK